MEYLEGETLASRLMRGALPLDRALKHGIEVSDALDTAHRHSVIHRGETNDTMYWGSMGADGGWNSWRELPGATQMQLADQIKL